MSTGRTTRRLAATTTAFGTIIEAEMLKVKLVSSRRKSQFGGKMLGEVEEWFADVRPDVVCMQETKLADALNKLSRDPRFKRRSVVMVFEGSDAAGKGGAIRRITAAIDARIYDVIPIAAPTDEERAQPYLWRFWRHLPRRGLSRLARADADRLPPAAPR